MDSEHEDRCTSGSRLFADNLENFDGTLRANALGYFHVLSTQGYCNNVCHCLVFCCTSLSSLHHPRIHNLWIVTHLVPVCFQPSWEVYVIESKRMCFLYNLWLPPFTSSWTIYIESATNGNDFAVNCWVHCVSSLARLAMAGSTTVSKPLPLTRHLRLRFASLRSPLVDSSTIIPSPTQHVCPDERKSCAN